MAICNHCRRELPLHGRAAGESLICSCGQSLLVPAPRPFHAAVWHCGSCGAGLEVGAKECGYCKTGLRPLDGKAFCARCLAYLEVDAHFCSHCGAHASSAEAMPQETEHACPRCGPAAGKLVGVPVGHHHGEACPRCEGLWLSLADFRRVVRDFSAPERQKPAGTGLNTPVIPSPAGYASGQGRGGYEAKVVYLPCPICSVRMSRQNYLKVSGIILDTCPEHGVWFDREELRRVADFLQAGGTLRAQKVESAEAVAEKRHAEAMGRLERGTPREMRSTWPSGIQDMPSYTVTEFMIDVFRELWQ